jgi:ribosomal protein S26
MDIGLTWKGRCDFFFATYILLSDCYFGLGCCLQLLCHHQANIWGSSSVYNFYTTTMLLLEALLLFTISMPLRCYYLRLCFCLQFLCHYDATTWDSASVYNSYTTTRLYYLRLCFCLQFLCHCQTIQAILLETLLLFTISMPLPDYTTWDSASVYNFYATARLYYLRLCFCLQFLCHCQAILLETLLLFTISMPLPGYTTWDSASVYNSYTTTRLYYLRLLLFTISMPLPGYTTWDSASVYNSYTTIRLYYLKLCFCLQFLCHCQAILFETLLLFENRPVFISFVIVLGYCLRPNH